MSTRRSTCTHCGRLIEEETPDGRWVDPSATGDDEIWRETCDSHDTFEAPHEPNVLDTVDPGWGLPRSHSDHPLNRKG